MANFEATVLDTFQKLTDLTEQIDATEAGMAQFREYLSQISEQIDQDWSRLEEKANSLLEQVSTAKNEFTTETEQMGQTLSLIQEKITAWQQETEQESNQTKTKINEFNEQIEVSQAEAEETLQQTNEALISLKDKTEQVGEELTTALAESQDFLEGELSTDLTNHQFGVEQQINQLETYITGECVPQVTDQLNEFVSRVDQLVQQLSTVLTQLGEGTQSATVSSLQSLNELRAQYNQLIGDANQLEGDLQGVAQQVERLSRTVSGVIDGLEDGVDTTSTGAQVVIGILNDVLASYEEAKAMF